MIKRYVMDPRKLERHVIETKQWSFPYQYGEVRMCWETSLRHEGERGGRGCRTVTPSHAGRHGATRMARLRRPYSPFEPCFPAILHRSSSTCDEKSFGP